ncbi:MAG: hypothetical protein ACOC2C_02715 [Cyclonatronaceae bacterium]
MRSIFYTLLIFIAAGACTTAPEQTIPRYVILEFEAEGIDEPIVAESDTLRIHEIKFLSRRFRITDQDSLVLQSSERIEPFLFAYDENTTGPFVSLDIQLQFDDIAPVNAFEMEFGPLQAGDPVLDDDFRGIDETFSLVLRGRINQRQFTYRSDLSFTKAVSFDPAVVLSDAEETLLISKSMDLERLFSKPGGGFYSPDSEEEMQAMEQAFSEELAISASAITR